MNQDFPIRTAGCPDYQRLLQECESALVAWKNRSEQIISLGLKGKSAGDGLQTLQAEYARAYHRLKRHANSCRVCSFAGNYETGVRITLAGGGHCKEPLA